MEFMILLCEPRTLFFTGAISGRNVLQSPSNVDAVIEKLSGHVISLLQPQVINSTAIRLTWQVGVSGLVDDPLVMRATSL